MEGIIVWKCSLCGAIVDESIGLCRAHQVPFAGVLDAFICYDSLKDRKDWVVGCDVFERFGPLLGVKKSVSNTGGGVVPLGVGNTPLFRVPRLEERLNVSEVWVKDETRNVSGSLKDRASAVVVADAMARGARAVATASTGNAAVSLAAACAAVGLACMVFVPKSCPQGKLLQMQMLGAKVFRINGTYYDALKTCDSVCLRFPTTIVNRTTAVHRLTACGKKTVLLEVLLDKNLKDLDVVITSVGDGNIISSCEAAIRDMQGLGLLVGQGPRLIGAQAAGSAMVAAADASYPNLDDLRRAWANGEIAPVASNTIADSLSADLPRDLFRAVRAVRMSGGKFVIVSDEEIQEAQLFLGSTCGLFVEPAAAASVAAALKLRQDEREVLCKEKWVIFLTGTGLKDIEGARQALGKANSVIDVEVGDVGAIIASSNLKI